MSLRKSMITTILSVAMLLSLNALAKEGCQKFNKGNGDKGDFTSHLDNPLVPIFRTDESFRGTFDGEITIVVYSDFECHYCSKGFFETISKLLKKYNGDIRYVYKHNPLYFHKNAEIAAKYYEAVRLQGSNKAFKFHDLLLKNQAKLSKNGESYLKKLTQQIGADLIKVMDDVKSELIAKRIEEDKNEAKRFGLTGTPSYVVNGIPVEGAYPVEYFKKIIEATQK